MSQDTKVIRTLFTTLCDTFVLSVYLCTDTVQQRTENQVYMYRCLTLPYISTKVKKLSKP